MVVTSLMVRIPIAAFLTLQRFFLEFHQYNILNNHITEKAFESIKVAYDAGVNFFDTAENYSAGNAEIVLGNAIKHFGWKQNDLVISTKVFSCSNSDVYITLDSFSTAGAE